MDQSVLRQIPKMDKLLERQAVIDAAGDLPRTLVRSALQEELQQLRVELLSGDPFPSESKLDERMALAIQKSGAYRLRRLVNATGIVLHTNLGRAPLGTDIAEHVAQTAAGYSNLEYNLSEGKRGSRYDLVEELLCRITGAEAALVVNNNASAVFLMLNTLAKGKKVAISRGELVEIGGSFRVPEIMSASGAELLEVGTTNKTHPADYARALEEQEGGALLKVHTSNFKLVGFSEDVALEDLRGIAETHEVPLLYDLGAGFLIRPEELGIHEGIYVPDAVKYADVCCFSGDKLFGAGQAGILLGRRAMINAMKKNQLTRMLRVDKMTLAALEGTLRWYLDPAAAKEHIPVLRMLSAEEDKLKVQAEEMAQSLTEINSHCVFQAIPCMDEPGGGSLPAVELPGWGVAVRSDILSPNELEQMLRCMPIPVIGRIWKDQLLLSVRTILAEDREAVRNAFRAIEDME